MPEDLAEEQLRPVGLRRAEELRRRGRLDAVHLLLFLVYLMLIFEK